MQSMRARKIPKVLTLYIVLVLLLPVWICLRFADLKGALRSQSNLFYTLIHLFTSHSTNTYWTDILGSERESDLPEASDGRTQTRIQVKYSCNCITQMKDLLGLLRLCNKKQRTSSQSLRFLPILFSICVHASKATLQLPSFCFCTRPERKFIFQHATFSLWQTLIYFVIDVPGRHIPHLLEWWHN